MARKRAGSIDSDDSTNARAERRAKRTLISTQAYRGEVGYRLGRLLYRVIAFCVLALSITGGHIAHVHGRAVLYFIGLWPQVPRGSNQWLVINKSASNPDEKYWLSAAVDLAILAARTRRRRPPTPSPRHSP